MSGNYTKLSCLLIITLTLLIILSGCKGSSKPDFQDSLQSKVSYEDESILLSTTTSTDDSGLLEYLNHEFTAATGIRVLVIAQGTGAALETGSRGDADVLLVHDHPAELELVEEGVFVNRYDLMYNDFIIVGPVFDPAGIGSVITAAEAFRLIADSNNIFVSRGDDSGTDRMEQRLWQRAGLEPTGEGWYLSVGQGMGDTLRVANETLGYTLSDRGTFAAISENLELVVLLEGDPYLFNQYGIMTINPDLHPHVKHDLALIYIDFLMSDQGQQLIRDYRVNGEALFFPGSGLE